MMCDDGERIGDKWTSHISIFMSLSSMIAQVSAREGTNGASRVLREGRNETLPVALVATASRRSFPPARRSLGKCGKRPKRALNACLRTAL